jgi:histone H3/H4
LATIDVVRSMRARIPWAPARRLLKSHGLERAQGWNRTVARVAEGQAEYDAAEDELQDALEEHIMCGEKIVQIFELDADELAELRNAAAALDVPNGPFTEAYPILLSEDELAAQQGVAPVLIANVNYRDGRALVLASVRFLTTRETVVVAELTDEAAEELAGFNELIGIRHQRLEALDVLWIPDEGSHVELRVDFPFGMYHRHGMIALEQARSRFDALLGSNLGLSHINLFPVMQSLYDARGDGAMVELGFMVAGSAQKLEKTRRGEQCCREEAYHQGGIGVLDAPIQVYRTSVLWYVNLGSGVSSTPEVTISGTSGHTAEANPFIGEMVVRNCTGFDDYDHVRDRILDHLPTEEA